MRCAVPGFGEGAVVRMFERMTSAERIKLAQARMERVLENFLYLLKLNANNYFIVYTPTLSRQIRPSFAANAFNVFQRSMYQIEIVRLCALWDAVSHDERDREQESIPLVVELIDNPSVINELVATARSQYRSVDFLSTGITPDEAEAIAASRGRREAKRARGQLKTAIKAARAIMASSRLAAVINTRDKHIAHSLAVTRREKKGPVAAMANRDGRDLLKKSAPIAETLYRWINGKGFSIADSKKINKKNAQALWKGCKIKVLR
jgi:AbiU2